MEQWYTGHILSAVEGSAEWFNVQYDGNVSELHRSRIFKVSILVGNRY